MFKGTFVSPSSLGNGS